MSIQNQSLAFNSAMYNFLEPYFINGGSRSIDGTVTLFPVSSIFWDLRTMVTELPLPALTFVPMQEEKFTKHKCDDPSSSHPFLFEKRISIRRNFFSSVSKNKVYTKPSSANLRASSQDMANEYYCLLASLVETQVEELSNNSIFNASISPSPQIITSDLHYISRGVLSCEFRIKYKPN